MLRERKKEEKLKFLFSDVLKLLKKKMYGQPLTLQVHLEPTRGVTSGQYHGSHGTFQQTPARPAGAFQHISTHPVTKTRTSRSRLRLQNTCLNSGPAQSTSYSFTLLFHTGCRCHTPYSFSLELGWRRKQACHKKRINCTGETG